VSDAALKFTLHHGPLGFSARSQGEGPLVLCLHGFPDNASSYRHQLPVLAQAGYRAVSVTLRGYEPSSQPADDDYSLASIAGDVVAFIDELGAERAHLVGHDWGAAIAYTAGAASPERFVTLTTMAVPHAGRFLNEVVRYPKQLRLSWYMGFFQLRGFADRTVEREDFAFIRRLWRDWSPGWEAPPAVLEDVIETLGQPGVRRAALEYYRTALTPRVLLPSVRAANRYKVPVPVLAITGADDGCIDTRVFERLMYEEDFPEGVRVERIPNAGHFPHQEQPEAVNRLLLDWLGAHAR